MKKGLAAFALLLVLVMTASVFVPAFAANAPVVVDFTKGETEFENKQIFANWTDKTVGYSEYDSDQQAWKLEIAAEMYYTNNAYQVFHGYESLDFNSLNVSSEHKFGKIVYKTEQFNDGHLIALYGDDKNSALVTLQPSADYTSVVFPIPDGFSSEKLYISLGAGDHVRIGDIMYVQYIAFFATEDEANAFDISTYIPPEPQPDSSVSEPESSAPESSVSEPESSAPESSESEAESSASSASDNNEGNNGGNAVIYVIIAAAVVAVVVVVALISKKKKA